MAAADAGQHGRDMPVTDVERLAELAVAPGDSRQPSLEGGDRKLRAAALDLRREIEPDRLGIGRRLREALAAEPGGEHFPVGCVGPPGVVGLRRAGVGLGGVRQAANRPLSALAGESRAGGAPLPTPRRRQTRPPGVSLRRLAGADQRKQGERIWRGGLAPPGGRAAASVQARSRRRFAFRRPRGSLRLVRDGFKEIGRAVRAGSLKASQPAVQAAGREGRGRGGRPTPRRTPPRRSPTPRRHPTGPAAAAASGPMAQGLGAPRAAGPSQPGRAGGRRAAGALRAAVSDASAIFDAPFSAPFRSRPGALRVGFVRVFHCRPARSESCPIMQTYRTSPHHDKRGG